MSSCVSNKRVSGGEKHAHTRCSSSATSLNGTHHYVFGFMKDFDSIHHSTLWEILGHYGLPQKIVDIISILYQNFECSVLMERNQTSSFSVRSGVRQGCILDPILFNIALDYIMRQTTQNAQHGI